MNRKLYLSYSTINNLYISPHSWVNYKVMGIRQPVTPAMEAGRIAHEVFTNHVCGIKKDPRITVDLTFQKPEYNIFRDYSDGYGLYGFVDAVDFRSKTFCEFKTSSSPWSQRRFDELRQIPLYAYALGFRKVFMVNSTADFQNFRVFYKEVNQREFDDVKEWIDQAIVRIEMEDFYDDLVDEKWCDGKCPFNFNCYFYKNNI